MRLVLAAWACLAVAGCAAVIVPPAQVGNPVKAAVLDHGRHSSLLLERPDGSLVRYAYGEWEWYALGRTGAGRAFGALFLPSEAALGRRAMAGPLSVETARVQVRDGFEAIFIFDVEAQRAEHLARRLDDWFQAGQDRVVKHPSFDLDFVPVPASYWLGRNSNRITAEWLVELGCRVDDPGMLSVWRMAAG